MIYLHLPCCFVDQAFSTLSCLKYNVLTIETLYIKYLKYFTYPTIHKAHIDLTIEIWSQDVKGIALKL